MSLSSADHTRVGATPRTPIHRRFSVLVVAAPLAVVALSGSMMAMVAAAVDEGSTVSDFETSMTSFAAMTIGGFAVVALIISLGAERFPADRRRYAPWPLTVAASAGTTTVVSTSFGNSAAIWPMLPAALLAGAIAGGASHQFVTSVLAEPMLPRSTDPAPAEALRRGTPIDRTAVWSGRVPTRSRFDYLGISITPLLGIGIMLYLWRDGSSLGSAFGSGWPMLFIGLIPALKFEADRVRVTVGPAGLIIRNGLTRRIAYAVGLEHINSAWFTNAPKPHVWGTYGKKSSSKRLSFLSRKGPALLVRLTDDTDIVVALDRPEEAAGIVNDLLDRRISSPPAGTLR